jgi:hypothetical protein
LRSSAARLANVDVIRKSLGLTPAYDQLPGIDRLKIAVLDYGFEGIGGGPRRYLPENTVVVEHYDPAFVRRFNLGDPDYRKSFSPLNAHGRSLAQIVWAVTGFHPGGPQFYLLNANGPTMLRRAVRYAIEARVDIILFGGTFEGGGNGDGRGPINRVVADALAADILWINAAGNYGGHVYNGSVDILPSGYLRLGNGPDKSALRFRNLLDENTVTITLTWNDYREKEDAGTAKDLDLYVEDLQGWVLGSSELRQVTASSPPVPRPEPDGKAQPAAPQESRNPRERIVLADLPADRDNDYLIRIKAKGATFTADDKVRVLITSTREGYIDPSTGMPAEAVQFRDATRTGEIYPPADNPLVITVGDTSPSSALGPTADYRRKPDIILEDSTAAFTNGDVTSGASNAAACFAGVVALLKAAEPGLRTRHLLWFAHHDPATRTELARSTALAGSMPRSSTPLRNRPRLAQSATTSTSRYLPAVPRSSPAPRTRAGTTPLPPSSSPSAWSQAPPTWANAGTSETLPPPREVGAPTAPSRFVWRTPTREHLASVVHDESARR